MILTNKFDVDGDDDDNDDDDENNIIIITWLVSLMNC